MSAENTTDVNIRMTLDGAEVAARRLEDIRKAKDRLDQSLNARKSHSVALPMTREFAAAQQGLVQYSAGLSRVERANTKLMNGLAKQGQVGLHTWDDLHAGLNQYLETAKDGSVRVKQLSAEEAKHFQDVATRMTALHSVWGRLHKTYTDDARQSIAMADQMVKAEDKVVAAKIGGFKKLLSFSGRLESLRSGNAKRDVADILRVEGLKGRAARAEEAAAAADGKRRAGNHKAWISALGDRAKALAYGYSQEDKAAKAADRAEAAREKSRERGRKIAAGTIADNHNAWIKGLQNRVKGMQYVWSEEDKARKADLRAVERHEREKTRLRGRGMQHGERAMSYGRRAMYDIDGTFHSPSWIAAGAVAGAIAAARSAIQSAVQMDTSETFARIHMELQPEEVGALRRRSTERGIDMGMKPADTMMSTVEAAKAGVPNKLAEDFTEMAGKLSKIFGMNVKDTTESMGYAVSQEVGAGRLKDGPQGLETIRKLGNSAGYLASKMATRPDAMLSFMRSGMGSGALMGLSHQDTLAFGAAATSAGAQGQQAARMLGHIGDQLHELPLRAQDVQRKTHKSAEDKVFLQVPKLLGYGTYQGMTGQLKRDPGKVFEMIERFGRIKDPWKRDQALTAVFGADFKRYVSNLVSSPKLMHDARQFSKEAAAAKKSDDFMSDAWRKFLESFEHMIDEIDASWTSIKDRIGVAFKPLVGEFTFWFSQFAKNFQSAGFDRNLRSFMYGGIRGISGGKAENLKDLLGQWFGTGQGGNGRDRIRRSAEWGDFGEGLFKGLRGVYLGIKASFDFLKGLWSSLSTVLSKFGFDTSTPEAIGKLAGSIIGLSLAMRLVRPVINVFSFFKDALMGLFNFGMGIAQAVMFWKLLKAGPKVGAGAMAGAGAAAGAGAGAAGTAGAVGAGEAATAGAAAGVATGFRALGAWLLRMGLRGLILGAAGEIGARRGELVTMAIELGKDFGKSIWEQFKAPFKKGVANGLLYLLDPNLGENPYKDGDKKDESKPEPFRPVWPPQGSTTPAPAPERPAPRYAPEPDADTSVFGRFLGLFQRSSFTDRQVGRAPERDVAVRVLRERFPDFAPPAPAEAPQRGLFQLAGYRPGDDRPLADRSGTYLGERGGILPATYNGSGLALLGNDHDGRQSTARQVIEHLRQTANEQKIRQRAENDPLAFSRAGGGRFNAGVAGNFQGPGGPADPARQFGSNFFTPGTSGPQVPGWYGRGGGAAAGAGAGGANPPSTRGPQGPLGDRMRGVYQAYRSAGLSHEAAKSFAAEIGRENGYQERYLYGTHRDPHNGALNAGMMSWQGDRATKMLNFLRERGQLNPDGSIKQTQEALNAQAQFSLHEMRSGALGARGQRALGVLNDPNATHAQRALTLGDDVIKWRQHDPRYAHHRGIRDGYYSQLGGLTDASNGGAAPAAGQGGAGAQANANPGNGAGIPGLSREGQGQYAGLRVKGAQATGGGGAHLGVTDLARQAQENLPGGVKHFAAFNDHYHAGTNSKHASGLAFDTSLVDPSKSREAAEAMRSKLRAAGLGERDFKVIDEYLNPSSRSTGGHLHTQFNSREAAQKYHEYIKTLPPQVAGAQPGAPDPAAVSAMAPNVSPAANPVSQRAANAVDIARTFEGMNENTDHAKLGQFVGHEVRGDINAWCARFVNSSLKSAGIQGRNSPVASSYLNWGSEVGDKSKIAKGDVLVEDHRDDKSTPFKPGMTGGHVGLATGKTKMENGKLMIEAVSGNHDNSVKTDWVSADEVKARRAPGAELTSSQVARDVVQGFQSNGWQPGAGGNAAALGAPSAGAAGAARQAVTPQDAARAAAPQMPSPADATRALPSPADRGVAGGMGQQATAGGSAPQIHAPITINAANQSPQEMGSHLQRHIGEAWNFRAHDLEPELT